MQQTRPVLLTNARLIDPATGSESVGAIALQDGVIAALGAGLDPHAVPQDAEKIDVKGRVVTSGLIDLRAFVGEPGHEYRETLASASKAAAAGGVTTVVTMPDTHPVVDDPAVVDFLMRRARDTANVHMLPAAALTKGMAGQEMTEFGLLKDAGAVFMTDARKAVADPLVMRRALTYARDFDILLVQHVEEQRLAGGVMNEGELASRLGLSGIPREAETLMLERDMRLVRLTAGRYHAAMISCGDSVEIMRRSRQEGLNVSCGVSINSLTLNENDIGPYRTFLKLSPPLRAEEDRQAVIAALAEGLIDVIVSDHDPQDVEAKRQPFAECADGAVGLQTLLSAAMRLVHNGDVSLVKILRALSARPAELLGLPHGRLKAGAPADVIVFDPDEPYVLDPSSLHSLCHNTAFDQARLQGVVHLTVVGGRIVHRVDGGR
jgi:dihydroorotase